MTPPAVDGYDGILSRVIAPIAEACAADRIRVCKRVKEFDKLKTEVIYKWDKADGGTSEIPENETALPDDDTVAEWAVILYSGGSVNGGESLFIAPVYSRGTIWGVVSFENLVDGPRLNKGAAELMNAAAVVIANMVIHAETEREIAEIFQINGLVYEDAVTGIYNRHYFIKAFNRILKTLSRSHGAISLMMIDIDFFKQFNDRYGHVEGDECVRAVSAALAETATRADDFVARYGGDEFVVVLPNTDERGACKVAERMVRNVEAMRVLHGYNEASHYVTISIGVTTGRADHSLNESDFVRKADQMLYASKADGRNRYTFGQMENA